MNHSDGDTAAYSKCWCVETGRGARGREHVRLVWVDAEGDPEEEEEDFQTLRGYLRKKKGGDKGMGKEGGRRGMFSRDAGKLTENKITNQLSRHVTAEKYN